jgi:uncharacterized membrane protein
VRAATGVRPGRPIAAGVSGVVAHVDVPRLVQIASDHDLLVEVVPKVGDFVVIGGELLRVWGDADAADVDASFVRAIELAPERSARQDIDAGLRQLVDIAQRALSPGVNDPTTAVTCIDRIHDLLRRLSGRCDPSAVGLDSERRVRAVVPVQRWEDHVGLALDEIRHRGADSLQVRARLQVMVDDLLAVTECDRRRRPLVERLPLWTDSIGSEQR